MRNRSDPGGRWPCAALALLLATAPLEVSAEPAGGPQGLALVLGTSTYASQPPVPACRGAAEAVAEALRGIGFAVTERQNPGRSEFDAALAGFSRARAAAPERPAVIYVCGMAMEWNGRAFLVPASAALARDSDTLTQGILARNAADAAFRGATGPSLVLLDLTPRPGGGLTAAGLAPAVESATAAGAGLVVVTGPAATLPVTPLAAALRAGLAGPEVELTALVAALRTRLPESTRLATVAPDGPRLLAGESPPAPLPPERPAAPAVALPTPALSAPATAASDPPIKEAALNEAQRRRIQAGLGVLGHYNGRVDGHFGPETRTAIRRYQASVSAEATGRLTAPQIAALIGSAR